MLIAQLTEDLIARFAEEQLFVRVRITFRNHVSPLADEQIEQLVDNERRRE